MLIYLIVYYYKICVGILCGKCKNGRGVSVLFNKCVDCNNGFGALIAALGS